MAHTGYFDGGSRGNPGIAGSGWVLYGPDGKPVDAGTVYVGDHATNNVAEYKGLLGLLEAAEGHNVRHLEIYGDSLLVINQILEKWRCSNKNMRALFREAMLTLDNLDKWDAVHVKRDLNKVADRLSNIAMDEKASATGLHLLRM